MNPVRLARIGDEPLDLAAHLAAVDDDRAGAVTTFLGRVRDHDPDAQGTVVALEYSAHPDAEATLHGIAMRAIGETGAIVAVSHRVGRLSVGDAAVVIAVAAPHRRSGHGVRLMTEVERVIRGAYDLGALSTSDEAHDFYAARGWLRWRGPTFAVTPLGIARTEDDDGGVYVLPVTVTPDLSGEITCDWRDGDVW